MSTSTPSSNGKVFHVGTLTYTKAGLFSLFALTENPRATVIAVEPVPQLFAILERNLNHHFDTGAVECVRALMLDEPGVQTLYYYADAPGESTRNPFERSMQRKRLATAMREGSRGGRR
jgi:FkbM family methyltransferase